MVSPDPRQAEEASTAVHLPVYLVGIPAEVASSLNEHFDAKVDRSGVHHVWLGATKADGSGAFKLKGRVVMACRSHWELAHGEIPDGVIVLACAEEPACVRT